MRGQTFNYNENRFNLFELRANEHTGTQHVPVDTVCDTDRAAPSTAPLSTIFWPMFFPAE